MTLAEIEALALTFLGENGTYYTGVVDAVNEGQRLFCLISLCLEATETLSLGMDSAFYNVLSQLSDFVLARRVFNSAGQQMRPASIAQLQALDSGWQSEPGTPTRYAMNGLDFMSVTPQPTAGDTLTLVHVTIPATLVNSGDTPQIRVASHWALANYAAWASRQVEGGQEFQKFQGYFDDFMKEAKVVAEMVLHRTPDGAIEPASFELSRTKR